MMCKNCGSSQIVKNGKVNNQQRYKCKECGKQFINNDNFARMRNKKHIIAVSMDLYYDGLSVRKIQRQISYLFKVKVSQVTIHNWITKYSVLVKEYVDTLKADLSDVWHTDETAIKIKGQQKWFWEIIDAETRFMVAEHLSNTRTIKDSTKLFMDARNRALQKPKIIYADGCFAYRKGFKKAFYSNKRCNRVDLVQNVGINGRVHQNKVERLHGTLKDMLRARRGMDNYEKTEAMLDGWFVYYNFLRPHSALGGKTPAEAAGINLDLDNRWESLIDLATKWKIKSKE
nr:IS6 family transposase [uncultured Methanobacterium sp.]